MQDDMFAQAWDDTHVGANLSSDPSQTVNTYAKYTPHKINASDWNSSSYGTGSYGKSNLRFGDNNPDTTLHSWYAMLFVILLFTMVCLCMFLREICARWWPGECGPSSLAQHVQNASRHGSRMRITPDPMGDGQQYQQEEEELEQQLELQRKERRLWYQYYLKPYIVVSVLNLKRRFWLCRRLEDSRSLVFFVIG